MKQFFSIVFGIAVFMTVSGLSLTVNAQTDTIPLSGNWTLKPVLASDTATGKLPTIAFDLVNHTFTGFTGCNNMNGRFAIAGNELTFNPRITVSKKKCAGYNEEDFLANLLRVTGYKINDGVLTLLIGSAPISIWVRNTRAI